MLACFGMKQEARADTVVSLCRASPLEGFWVNTKSDLERHDVWRLEITGHCSAGETLLKIRVETECGRTACRWGRSDLLDLGDGVFSSLIRTFAADRRVTLRQRDLLIEGDFVFNFNSATRKAESQSWFFSKTS